MSIDATIYADDASVYQANLSALQGVVDAAMLFCGFTGMRCNLDKCWWMATFGVADGDEPGFRFRLFVSISKPGPLESTPVSTS